MLGAIDPDLRMRLRSGAVVWHEVDGEVLALALERGEYVSANGSATELWRMLDDGATIRGLADALTRRWGLNGERALQDARGFVRDLDAQGLIELAG